MRARLPLAGVLVGLLAGAAGLSACSSSTGGAGSAAIVVTGTDTACTPATTQVPAGTVAFRLENKGSRVNELYVLRSDGSRTCLLDIPKWNFHWQGFYRFRDPVPLHAGDRVLMECHWDNSPANLVSVCGHGTAGCHGAIHAAPGWARDCGGWLVKGSEDPARVRVLVEAGSRWVHLTADSRYSDRIPEVAA